MSTELTLTDRETRRLKSLEDTIRQSAGDMYDAMRAIHDEKLYRAEFSTWQEYCGKRWNISARHADRLMEHGRVLALLSDDDLDPKVRPIGPISEAATREVAALPDEKKVEVIETVARETKAKTGKPKITAAAVKEKVKEIAAKVIRPKKSGSGTSPAKLVDELSKKHVAAMVRGIDAVAEVNGGKGLAHVCANDALNDLIAALKRMRGGEK